MPAGERRLVVDVQDEVLGHRRSRRPGRLPGGPRGCSRCRRGSGRAACPRLMSRPPRLTVPRRRPQAHQRLAQLGLPVALHAGDAEDLAGPHLEGDRRRTARHSAGGRRRTVRSADVEHDRRPAWPASLLTRSCTVPARPSARPARRRWRSAGARRRPCRAGCTVIVSAIAWTSLSLCVMNTMDRPPSRSCAHDREQLLGLAGGEHRGRLVQDQHAGVAHQRLDDLDPLLHADGQVLDQGVRVDAAGRSARTGPAPRAGPAAGRAGRAAGCAPRPA